MKTSSFLTTVAFVVIANSSFAADSTGTTEQQVPNALINPKPTTFCNPLNLDYRLQPDPKLGYRAAADPVCVYFKGNYFIFASRSGGYWFSPDFVSWK